MSIPDRLPSVVRFLYNHNPFYLVSAGFVIYALKLMFRPGEVSYMDPWELMGAISAYTVLMAITGYLVVRWGQVWEDARTIFLVLLLLFLATSVTFDELLNLVPSQGITLIVAGYGLATLVSEALFLGLKIRLRMAFRLPYHLWLVLLYFFPLFVSPELTKLGVLDTSWRLSLFPVLSCLLTLSLLPAVWRGSAYCADNGTPWRWPLFPWTLFLFIWLANGFRTYAITISFLPSDAMQTAFQTYFLVPLVFGLSVILLEMGITEKRAGLSAFSLWCFPLLMWLANQQPVDSIPATQFLNAVTHHFGSPLWLTLLAYLALCGYARWRREATAEAWSIVALLIAMKVSPETHFLFQDTPLQMWPFIIFALWMGMQGIRKSLSIPTLLAALCITVVCMQLLMRIHSRILVQFEGLQLALASFLIIGCLFRDPASEVVRRLGALLLPLMVVLAWALQSRLTATDLALVTYSLFLTGVAGVCWRVTRNVAYLYSLLSLIIAQSLGVIVLSAIRVQQRLGLQATLAIFLGAISFLMATSISALKGGLGARYFPKWLEASDVSSESVEPKISSEDGVPPAVGE